MKRRLVAAVTFIAGLYYFLEFILPPQFGGDFDHARLVDPDVQQAAPTDRVRYRLWYVGFYDEARSAIGLAESDDGQTWRKWSGHPVLRPTSLSSFDARGLASPSVVQEADGSFTMFYLGHGADAVDRVGRATSPDGRRWRREGVVLDLAESKWMKPRLAAVRVRREEGGYRMWLAGTFRRGEQVVDGVSLATSRDGRAWTVDERSPVLTPERTGWDSFKIISLDVERTATGAYRMWYVATRQERQREGEEEKIVELGQVGLAMSPDGVRWTKHAANPLAPEYFGDQNVTSISVVAGGHGGRAGSDSDRLFYTAKGSAGEPEKSLYAVDLPPLGKGGPGGIPPFARGGQGGVNPLPLTGKERKKVLLTAGRPAHTTYLSDWSVPIADFLVVVAAMAVGLSLYSLAQANWKTLRRQPAGGEHRAVSHWDRAGAIAFFVSFALMVVFAHWRQADEGHVGRKIYNLLFYGFLFPFGASSMGLLAFYLASAAYRAFKVRSLEAALLIGSAMIVMLGQVPLGQWLTHGLPPPLQVQTWSGWILYVINGAALRGVALGAAVGGLAMALRLWLSLERRGGE